ncbi:hypothetical protein TNIN_30341 [Trichonephila inaurata madagascariensis]|uniref:Uncharacterized protein n=1 Tax=Trichonephila inaurata madagascariensis TaxID=2747483 RepID=A0A8X7CIZ5_9ARAC|nr:hypothetical protein TNIN_30341 [Trichonephila inaurata madagascariensis]
MSSGASVSMEVTGRGLLKICVHSYTIKSCYSPAILERRRFFRRMCKSRYDVFKVCWDIRSNDCNFYSENEWSVCFLLLCDTATLPKMRKFDIMEIEKESALNGR